PVTDLGRMVRQTLRNVVLEVEQPALPRVTLACWDSFEPAAALHELRQRAHDHRISRHPLLRAMASDGRNREALQVFREKYLVNNRVFHLHVAAQSLSAPLEMRAEMYQNLYDELGRG